VRRKYFQTIHDLIKVHNADLVAEEFSAENKDSYAKEIAALHNWISRRPSRVS
jgi:hypothetical protein